MAQTPNKSTSAAHEAMRAQCHTLLLTDRYNPAVVLQPLEDALNSQCADGWYDADLNTALLKLYQMYPSEQEKIVKVDLIIKLLLKAVMQLPEPDFALAMMMVPVDMQNLEIIRAVCALAEKLQTACFPEFWDLARANQDLVQKVPGFQAACRRYILKVVGMTFREISSVSLAKYLGLGSSRDLGGALASEGLAFLDENDGIVVLPSNPDNHPKSTRLAAGTQEVRIEQIGELIAALETKPKRQGQVVSSTAKNALQQMKKKVAETQPN